MRILEQLQGLVMFNLSEDKDLTLAFSQAENLSFDAIPQVTLSDGTEVQSSTVLSNATPYRTFMVLPWKFYNEFPDCHILVLSIIMSTFSPLIQELLPPNSLPEDFICAIKNIDYSSVRLRYQC